MSPGRAAGAHLFFRNCDRLGGPVSSLRSASLGRFSIPAPDRRWIDASILWPPPCGDASIDTVNYSRSFGSYLILVKAAGVRLEATADRGGGRL